MALKGLHKGRLQKKKNVKFGLLAEIRRGRGLKGVFEPNLLSGIFSLFKNYLIAPKHEIKHKKCYNTPPLTPPQFPQNPSRFFKEFNSFARSFPTISDGLKVLHKAVSCFEGCRFE